MARKRLNKKVALVGSFVFLLLAVAAIGVMLYLSRDPKKSIREGDTAIKAAREATDPERKEDEYKRAERYYHEARGLAKTDSQTIEALFRLVDVFIETDQWRNVLGCWNRVVHIDPANVEARFGRLRYLYMMADSGVQGAWREVASQASELIEVVEEKHLLMEDPAQWDPFEAEKEVGRLQIGPYLYLLRGRAVLEEGRSGAVTDRDEYLSRAVDDLRKVQELEPNNIEARTYLALAIITRGEILASSTGDFEQRDRSIEQAIELMEQAVAVAGSDPRAYINLLSMKLVRAQRSASEFMEEQVQSLEPEYLSLVERYPSSAAAFSALAAFYRPTLKHLDKAVEAAEKAVEFDKESVAYARVAADLYYRRFSIYGQERDLRRAIEKASRALELPNAQDKPGPRRQANRRNRVLLYTFLAECYLEQVIEPPDAMMDVQEQELIVKAEQAVHEIEQIFGIGDAPAVIKWRGMLDLAKGKRNDAIKRMYAAYEQLESVGQKDSLLSYRLAKVFNTTAEIGAAREFFESALRPPGAIYQKKPEALLDYAETLLKLGNYGGALNATSVFEGRYWTNERSERIRIEARIWSGQFAEAEKELAERGPDDPNTVRLQIALVQAKIRQKQRALSRKDIRNLSPMLFQDADVLEEEKVESEGTVQLIRGELKGYHSDLAALVEKLLSIEPNFVAESSVMAVCNNYVGQGKTKEAKALADTFIESFPDNMAVLFYRQLLSEPEPRKVSEQRRIEIEEQVLSSIADPVQRAINLGRFYRRSNELEKAATEFRKVFKPEPLREGVSSVLPEDANREPRAVEKPVVAQTEETTESRRLAAFNLFEIALATKDWRLAEQIAKSGRHENLDNCEGQLFNARLAMAKEQYEEALAGLDECLRQRPVFSHGFSLRSNVNAALGNEHASIEDAQEAASLNPLDGSIAKGLAFVLYRRNQKLGDSVSHEQVVETKNALRRAMSRNPGERQLQSFYAEYLSDESPYDALAIRQHLQKVIPSVENALLLGRMAVKIALGETSAEKRKALFDIAASSFEQARAIDPESKAALGAQAEYYRISGQEEKAKELLEKSQDQRLLYTHYFRLGKFEEAKRVLEKLYEDDPKDSEVVRGLLSIAERTADKQAVERYSEELLSLEDSADNRLIQIQDFLNVGLVEEAGRKLQSFGEKYPDDHRALLLEAWLAMRQGRLKKALELTNQYLGSDESNVLAWRLRGQINLLMTDYAKAIDDFNRSKLLSDRPVTRYYLAKAYLQAGRVEDAITELKNTIDDPHAPMASRDLLESILLKSSGRKEALRRFYEDTIAKFQDSVTWYNRAAAFAIAEGQLGRAEQLYQQAWQKDSKDVKESRAALDGYLRALVMGAGTPNTSGWDPAKLEKLFEEGRQYVDGDFSPIVLYRMAEGKMKLGDKATAVEYCRKALEKAFGQTDEAFAAKILQDSCSLLGVEEVSKCCEQTLEANPESVAANFAMFSLTRITGEYNKAIAYIDKCLQITGPDSPGGIGYMAKKAEILDLAYAKTSDNSYLERAIKQYESL
ncbi:MAG: tetratricopeptide repeat protein, partial [Planctomycetota bacterium]